MNILLGQTRPCEQWRTETMKKKRKKEEREANLRWLLSLAALLMTVVPGGVVVVFSSSFFPVQRHKSLFFLLVCFCLFFSVCLSILRSLSLSGLSSLSLLFRCCFFLFSFSLFCYISPLCVFVPHCLYSSMFFFPFFSLLF